MQVYLMVYGLREEAVQVLLVRKNLMYGPNSGNGWTIGARRKVLHSAGQFVFPGGGKGASETPAEGAAREFFEETGYSVFGVDNIERVAGDGDQFYVGCVARIHTDVPWDNPSLHGRESELCELAWFTLNEAKGRLGPRDLGAALDYWRRNADGPNPVYRILIHQYNQINQLPQREEKLQDLALEMLASGSWYQDALDAFIEARRG